MQRYFAKAINNEIIELYDQDIYHIKKVMRNTINDKIEVVYDEKVYLCEITSLDPFEIIIISKYTEDRKSNINLTIAISLVQEQKFDLIIQKLTELGVNKIIPVKTERSIVKLEESKKQKKIDRWQMICKEASEQCHRTSIPKVENIKTIKELIENDTECKLICSLSETTKPLANYLTKDKKELLFFIGPEGGFSENEERFLLENNFKAVTLGKRVLRVETAAIYVASIINYIYEG